MVQFLTNSHEFIPRPEGPRVCPKCGSHRTQVVGTCDDPTKVNMRCSNCGAVSTVPAFALSFTPELRASSFV
jgi:hypothetical protein